MPAWNSSKKIELVHSARKSFAPNVATANVVKKNFSTTPLKAQPSIKPKLNNAQMLRMQALQNKTNNTVSVSKLLLF
jgi:hypothetical protein